MDLENFSEESSIKAKSETVSEISVLPSISISSSCPDIHILDGIARSLISEDPCTPGNDSMDSDGEHGRIVVFSTDFGPLRNISMEYFKLLGSPTSTLQKYPKDRSPDNRIYFSALNASAFFVYGLQSSGMSDTAVCLLGMFQCFGAPLILSLVYTLTQTRKLFARAQSYKSTTRRETSWSLWPCFPLYGVYLFTSF